MMDIEEIKAKIRDDQYLYSLHAEKVVLITVYVPRPPKFVDPWTRGGGLDG